MASETASSLETRQIAIEMLAYLYEAMPPHERTVELGQKIIKITISLSKPEGVRTMTAEDAHVNAVKRRVEKIKDQFCSNSGCRIETPTADFLTIEHEVETQLKTDGFDVQYYLKMLPMDQRERVMVLIK